MDLVVLHKDEVLRAIDRVRGDVEGKGDQSGREGLACTKRNVKDKATDVDKRDEVSLNGSGNGVGDVRKRCPAVVGIASERDGRHLEGIDRKGLHHEASAVSKAKASSTKSAVPLASTTTSPSQYVSAVASATSVSRQYATSWFNQVRTLLSRSLAVGLLEEFSWDNIGLYLGISFIAAVVWVQLSFDANNIFKRVTCVLWLVSTWMFFPMFNALMVFPAEETMVKKELSLSAYKLSAYYCARSVSLLAISLGWPVLYTSIVFWVTALSSSGSVFILVRILSFLTASPLFIYFGVSPQAMMRITILCSTLYIFACSSYSNWIDQRFIIYSSTHLCLSNIRIYQPLRFFL